MIPDNDLITLLYSFSGFLYPVGIVIKQNRDIAVFYVIKRLILSSSNFN